MSPTREKKPTNHQKTMEDALMGNQRLWLYVLIVVLWTLIGFLMGRMIYPRCPASCAAVMEK